MLVVDSNYCCVIIAHEKSMNVVERNTYALSSSRDEEAYRCDLGPRYQDKISLKAENIMVRKDFGFEGSG